MTDSASPRDDAASGEDEQEQSDTLQDALEAVPDDEITVENVGGDEERAFDEAWREVNGAIGGVGIPIERNISISRLDEDRIKILLQKLREVEDAWADAGDHQGAKSASDMRTKINRAAIEEGIIDE
jgi:hypothetical protein